MQGGWLPPNTLCTHDASRLQEVEDYGTHYQPFLESLGMDSVFVCKPFKTHGCVLAWSRDRYVWCGDRCTCLTNP